MYQVFSIQRPGHPRWALAASGLLLLLSLGLAWALSQSKARGTYVPLEEQARDYPAGGLRARLPTGWRPLDKRILARLPAVVAGVVAPANENTKAFIFRGNHQRYALPSAHALDVLHEAFSQLHLGGEVQSGPAMIGPFFARTVRSITGDGVGGSPNTFFLARVAFAPDNQTFGILLLLPRKPTPQHEKLLDEMSQHLQLLSLSLEDSPVALMADAGIRFTLPPKAKLARPNPAPPPPGPQLRLMSGDPNACWYLTVWRTPLLGTRTCEQLVESLAFTDFRHGKPTRKPTLDTLADHEVARLNLSPDDDAETGSGAQIWCARMDAHNALLLVGRHEAQAESTLTGICEFILTGVTLSGTDQALDAPAALERGQQYLREVATEKLSTKWGDLVDHRQRFLLIGAAGTRLQQETSYQVARQEDRFRWWRLVTTYSPPGPLASLAPVARDEWAVRDDTAQHQAHIRWPSDASDDDRIEYTESRSGSSEVLCSLRLPETEPREWKLAIDDSYACQPVLIEAAAKAARDPDRHTAVFSTSEALNPHLSWVIATPLGDLPLPSLEQDRTAPAVQLRTDYQDEPEIVYFDEADHVIAVNLEGNLRLERENRSSRQEGSRSFFDRRPR